MAPISDSDAESQPVPAYDSQSSDGYEQVQSPRTEQDLPLQPDDFFDDFLYDFSRQDEIDRLHEEYPDLDSDALEDLHDARMQDDCESNYSVGS